MFIVYLSLGSNLGDRRKSLEEAGKLISEQLGNIKARSSVYETAAWGKEDQPNFLNQVLAVETNLSPTEVLAITQEIERSLGRKRIEKWGSRTMDIDILLFGDLIINTTELIIPHQFLHERRFCLEPLNEIAPDAYHPVFESRINTLLINLRDSLLVKKLT